MISDVEENGSNISSKFKNRKIVYIALGLPNSGKSERIAQIHSKMVGLGLATSIISEQDYMTNYISTVESRENTKKKFLDVLLDPKIRRIFVDDCNLDPELREFYIKECESISVEWSLVPVGTFKMSFAKKCFREAKGAISWDVFESSMSAWSSYYGSQLRIAESLRDEGFEHIRFMRDTRLVAVKEVDEGFALFLGIKTPEDFVRCFIFKTKELAIEHSHLARLANYSPPREVANMKIGRKFNITL